MQKRMEYPAGSLFKTDFKKKITLVYATEWQQWDRHTHGNSYLVLFLVLFLFFWENHPLYSVFWAASQPKESYLKGYVLERISDY